MRVQIDLQHYPGFQRRNVSESSLKYLIFSVLFQGRQLSVYLIEYFISESSKMHKDQPCNGCDISDSL